MRATKASAFTFITLVALPATSPAAFKCETPGGQVMFTDQPCPSGQKSEAIEIEKPKKRSYTPSPPNCYSSEVASKISIGMSASEARAACGNPDDVNRTQTAGGVREQWVYGEFPHSAYVYVDDEVVTAIQD